MAVDKRFSMIEISLVPDIKRELLVAEKMRNQVSLISIIIGASSLAILLSVIMYVFIFQVNQLDSLDKEGSSLISSIKNRENVDQILTIQRQTVAVNEVHKKKLITSRLIAIINSILVPYQDGNSIIINNVNFNPHERKIIIEGYTNKGHVEIEKFKKSIARTKVQYWKDKVKDGQSYDQNDPETILTEENTGADSEQINEYISLLEVAPEEEFGKVALLDNIVYGKSSEGDRVLTFKLGFIVNEGIFDNNYDKLNLKIPGREDVTDSAISIPSRLFKAAPEKEDEEEDNYFFDQEGNN